MSRDSQREEPPSDEGTAAEPEVVFTDIGNNEIDQMVEAAMERESHYFRLTKGQRKTLVDRGSRRH
jgi:hypothetical protein